MFSVQPQRRHSSFRMTQGFMSAFDPHKLITWIKGHIQKHDQLSVKEQVIDLFYTKIFYFFKTGKLYNDRYMHTHHNICIMVLCSHDDDI